MEHRVDLSDDLIQSN